jgi:adenosylmethionine-8-amino-7-oxononanoate aminotransferase
MTRPNVHVVHRSWDREYPVMERAQGVYLYDREGKRYLDGSGGSAVVMAIGHGVDEVPRAMFEQAQKFSFSPAHAFTHQPMLDLADLVVDLAPGALKGASRVWFTCTGTDATDDAVRLARQYWVERGKPQVSGHQPLAGFHGNSISAAGYSALVARRKLFLPMFVDSFRHPPALLSLPLRAAVPSCNLKCARRWRRPSASKGRRTWAFIAEPVVGASLGAVHAPPGYFERIREICDRYEVLFIADEVMTGWGRTGGMWGIEHWGVTPDIVASAKGLTSGYTPLAVVIAREDLWATLEKAHAPFRAGTRSTPMPSRASAR